MTTDALGHRNRAVHDGLGSRPWLKGGGNGTLGQATGQVTGNATVTVNYVVSDNWDLRDSDLETPARVTYVLGWSDTMNLAVTGGTVWKPEQ